MVLPCGNAIIDHYRARDSRARATIDGPPSAEQAEDPFEDDPEQSRRELASCLRPLVHQLAEPYRAAVIAVDLEGRTQAEVAQTLGVSVSGMKSRVQRGRIHLRRVLTDCCSVVTTATGIVTDYDSFDSQDGGDKCSKGCG